MAELVKDKNAPPPKRPIGRIIVFVVVIVVLVSAGYYLWKYLNTYESHRRRADRRAHQRHQRADHRQRN